MSPSPEPWLGRIAKVLRAANEPVTREELPKRWIDLLLHLDERERRQSKVSPSASKTRTGAPEAPAPGDKDV